MNVIFDFFGGLLGYLLFALNFLLNNYALSIIFFTIIVKALMFPFSIKQQKSMAASSKLQKKVKEIQQKYPNDKMKVSEETQKLYQKEGVSPTGGCLPMLLPFPIMLGIFYAVVEPLKNVLHLNKDLINQATGMLSRLPGIGSQFAPQDLYREINLVKHFNDLAPHMTMFSQADMEQIGSLSRGFNFLGLDLLATPSQSGFFTFIWIVPVLVLITSYLSQIFMMRLQPGMQQQQQGCMKWMMYLMPLMSVWIAFVTPGAVGFYYAFQNIIAFAQTVIMQKFYAPIDLTARGEAARIARRVEEEAKRKTLSAGDQEILRAKLYPVRTEQTKKQQALGSGAQKAQSGKPKQNTNDYRGAKK